MLYSVIYPKPSHHIKLTRVMMSLKLKAKEQPDQFIIIAISQKLCISIFQP